MSIISSRFVHKIPLIIFSLDMILVLSLFIAPATLEPHTVEGLDGRANMMDYQDEWRTMDPFHAAVYTFGDFNCHQRDSRSLHINGNQMPLCARDVAIFTGILYGAVLLVRARASDTPQDTLLGFFPRKLRKKLDGAKGIFVVLFILGLLFVPTALDGGIQMFSKADFWPFGFEHESTNPLRVATGFPMGVSLGIVVTVLVMSLFSRRDDGSEPLLKFPVK
ncbi:MAG: DUF2085 domain-containing protein [Thermoplasmatota archaeon]